MSDDSGRFVGPGWQVGTICLLFVCLTILLLLISPPALLLCAGLAGVGLVYPPLSQRLTVAGRSLWLPHMVLAVGALTAVGILGYGVWLVRSGVLSVFGFVFAPVMALIVYQACLMTVLAASQRHFDPVPTEATEPLPRVSVLIPAYNEAGYIKQSMAAVLNSGYPEDKLELIVVNDGSTDGTYEEATAYADHDSVRVFTKDNGGKASALNYALFFATGEFVVPIDADSTIAEGALRMILAPMQANSSVGAVAGNVKVANRNSLLTSTQRLEYLVGINSYRRMYDTLRAVPVIPGCLGAFRYDALSEIREYDPDTLTEDYDATIQLLKRGYEIRASPAATYTEAPATWADLYRQRLRWYRGNCQTLSKHFNILTSPEYGYLHSVVFPLHMVSMVTGPLVTILVGISIAWGIYAGTLATLAVIATAFIGLGVLVSLLSVQLAGEDLRTAALALCLGSVYKLVNDAAKLQALGDVLFRSDIAWTSPRRVRQIQASRAGESAD